jgi:predicted PurR-regulated permease PerM
MVGVAVWAAFSVVGLPDAAGWGITAAVLHVVPYLGMALLTALGAAETFLAYGTVGAALGMAAFIVLLSTFIGNVVTAWLQGQAAKMNAATVFIGVVFWGELWGVWGLLLGPALVVLLKVVAEHIRPGQTYMLVANHQSLGDILVLAERTGLPEHGVDERRLAVVDVRDDRHISDVVSLHGPAG